MQTSELRERLASAFHEESRATIARLGGVARADIDWTSAYRLADTAMNVIKDCATIADLKHKKVIGEAPKFDDDLVLVACSCGGMSGVFSPLDCVDEVFDAHLSEMSE